MKLFIAATIVMLSIVSFVPQASAICAKADPEVHDPHIQIFSLDPLEVEVDPGSVDPGVSVGLGPCRS